VSVLEVGKPYIADQRDWPEFAEYKHSSGQHQLTLFLRSPSRDKIETIRTGECEFAVAVEGRVIFFLYRFGKTIPWSHASYSRHLVREPERTLPEGDGQEKPTLLPIALVEAATGTVQVVRAVTFSLAFTRVLHEAIRAQAAAPWPGRCLRRRACRGLRALPGAQKVHTVWRPRTVGEE
jgi:hypothetical protein